jgi:hypothetical protein
VTIAERYGRATRSSHLEMTIEVGDVDYLISAGLVRDTLATRLIRLLSEFDGLKRRTPAGMSVRLVVPLMAGFPGTRDYLAAHALTEAQRKFPKLTEPQVSAIAGRVLDLMLDPTCPTCSGRGFTGGYGVPQIRCASCRESGKRALMWETDEAEAFGRLLQTSLERKTAQALTQMHRLLRKDAA